MDLQERQTQSKHKLQAVVPGWGEQANRWTFTHERWSGSLLAVDGDRVECWNLHAARERAGYFRELVAAIEADGLEVAVVTPISDELRCVLEHYGFAPRQVDSSAVGPTEMWMRTK